MDFPISTIEIRYYSDEWGPFSFDFSDSIPTDTTITACTVKCYTGRVNPNDDISTKTDITLNVIDTTTVHTDRVTVTFQYPGSDYEGNHTLIFLLTLDSGAKHPFYFYKLKVV